MESYDTTIVQELYSNNVNDMEKNIKIIVNWVKQWMLNVEKNRNKLFESNACNKIDF